MHENRSIRFTNNSLSYELVADHQFYRNFDYYYAKNILAKMVCHFLRENLKNEECKMADCVTRNGRNIVGRKIHWQFS